MKIEMSHRDARAVCTLIDIALKEIQHSLGGGNEDDKRLALNVKLIGEKVQATIRNQMHFERREYDESNT